ncbi:metal-dependent transcriptional regulator [Thermogladius sp. 4427co]|uniref:metal-dependent transcriptional regulator n=1 Tax=Thermogladius sp. 4427co TaxID=3450718 RepID=UPI003F79306C
MERQEKDKSISARAEDYLEAIYMLSLTGRPRVRELARRLCVSPSSVVEFLKRLADQGYIVYKKGGEIKLTEKGLEIARKIYSRHQILTEFLTYIGVPRDIAEIDACKIEHLLHEETVEKITEFVKNKLEKE